MAMVVAIDGPAGSGKSTIARAVASTLGFYFLNTGSFYRAYTLSALDRGIDPLDREKVLENAQKEGFYRLSGLSIVFCCRREMVMARILQSLLRSRKSESTFHVSSLQRRPTDSLHLFQPMISCQSVTGPCLSLSIHRA